MAQPVLRARGTPARASLIRRWRESAASDPGRLAIMTVFGTVLVVLVAYPLARILFMSLGDPDTGVVTLRNYARLFTDPDLFEALANSLTVAAMTTVVAVLLALPVAWGLARTDLPMKSMIQTFLALTYASPAFIAAIAWALLLGPRGGRLNVILRDVFRLAESPFNIFTTGGIVFVIAMFAYPMVVFIVTPALQRMDPALEESARGLGAGVIRSVLTISIPLAMPAVLSGAILVCIEALVVYGPPALLGTPYGFYVLSTKTRDVVSMMPPAFELGAVLSAPIVVALAVLLLLRRVVLGRRGYATVGGKASHWQLIQLGFWKYPLLAYVLTLIVIGIFLPFGTLALFSLLRATGQPLSMENLGAVDNYTIVLRQPAIGRAVFHSLMLAFGGALIAIALGLIGGWLTERTKGPGKGPLMLLMTTSFCFPGIVVGVGLVLSFSTPPIQLYGTLWILLVAYVILNLPMAFLFMSSALKQLGPELEEAARGLGATWLAYTRDITVPLISNAMLAVGTLLLVQMFRELNASVLLQGAGTEVVAPTIVELYGDARYAPMAALSTIVIAITAGLVLVARRTVSDYLMRQ